MIRTAAPPPARSLDWINRYVGLPYRPGGGDAHGLDCWGLVRLVYRDELGTVLPDWHWKEPFGISAKLAAIEAALHDVATHRAALELEAPEPFAIALIVQGRLPHHCGVATGAGVLHAERSAGARHDTMQRFALAYPVVRWWRWPRS